MKIFLSPGKSRFVNRRKNPNGDEPTNGKAPARVPGS